MGNRSCVKHFSVDVVFTVQCIRKALYSIHYTLISSTNHYFSAIKNVMLEMGLQVFYKYRTFHMRCKAVLYFVSFVLEMTEDKKRHQGCSLTRTQLY